MAAGPLPRIGLLFIALAAASAGGCRGFVADRAHDLLDTANISIGYSEGFAVNLRATKIAQIGLGGYRGVFWAGLRSGELDVWMEERMELGVGPLYIHEVFRSRGHRLSDIRHPLFGDPGFREHSWDLSHLTDRGWTDVGFTANLVFLGIDMALRPAEILDLIAGFAGMDPLEDDAFGPDEQTLLDRLHGEDARVRAAAARALRRRFGHDFGYAVYTVPRHMTDEQLEAQRRWREALSPREGEPGDSGPEGGEPGR